MSAIAEPPLNDRSARQLVCASGQVVVVAHCKMGHLPPSCARTGERLEYTRIGCPDPDGGRADLDIAAQDGEDPGMTLDRVADQVRQGLADRTGQLADDDLGLGSQMILRAFDQCLTRPR